MRIGRVDGDGHSLEDLTEPLLALAHAIFSFPRFSHIEREASGLYELAVAELRVGCDEDVTDRTVLCAPARRVAVEFLAFTKPIEDVVDDRLVDVKIGDVAADVSSAQ